MTTRRELLISSSLIMLGTTMTGAGALVAGSAPARADAAMEDLLVAGPLGEAAIGAADAPVTIIEYASLTCSHCARFHNEIFPGLKEKYVDTGKVRFMFREFPLDPLAKIAFVVSRCLESDKYLPFVDLLFKNQVSWTRTNDPLGQLFFLSKQAGMSEEAFDKCTKNQQLHDGVNWVYERASTKFSVGATPTFFVNGKRVEGVVSLQQFDELIGPHLKG